MHDVKCFAQDVLASSRPALGIYLHYKGALYAVFAFSIKEDTLEQLVHYFSHEKKTRWTRTRENFFEVLTNPETGWQITRFTFQGHATTEQLLEASA